MDFLDEVKKRIPIYLVGRIKEKFLFLVEENIAVVCATPEIFDMFENMMGFTSRTSRLYISNDFTPKMDFEVEYVTLNERSFVKPNHLLNMFLNKQGFDKLLELIAHEW